MTSLTKPKQLDSISVAVEGLEEEREIGRGCNGVVYEVRLHGLPCIAKRLHDILVGRGSEEQVNEEERLAIIKRFREECELLSGLRHPNIVQFMGIHYGLDEADISLIMERIHMDLEYCMKTYPNIPLPYKTSILGDVAYGLAYLHSKNIIHRDLNAGNVLLTESLRAKIADLGVAKLFDIEKAMERTKTRCPGALDFMPPEALSRSPRYYDDKLDVFSFGHLAIYLINQDAPHVEDLAITTGDVRKGQIQVGKRRDSLEQMGGPQHPLYSIVVQCLSDLSDQRPTSRDLVSRMGELCEKHPLSYAVILDQFQGEKLGRKEVESRQLIEENLSVAELVVEIKRLREEIEAMQDANKKQKLKDDSMMQKMNTKLMKQAEEINELSKQNASLHELSVKLNKEQSTSNSSVNFKTLQLKTRDHEVEAQCSEIKEKNRQLQLAKKDLEQLKRGASNSVQDSDDDEFDYLMNML